MKERETSQASIAPDSTERARQDTGGSMFERSIGAPRMVHFSLERTLAEIPEPEPCPVCKGRTSKATLPYECHGVNVIVCNDDVPGYVCTDCGAGLFDRETTLQLVLAATHLLIGKENRSRRAELRQEAARLRGESASGQRGKSAHDAA